MRRRVFAFLMTLVLLVSMIPTSVFAEDTAGIYQIGDTVTNDGTAQPAGATVENSYWVRKDVYDPAVQVCTKEVHDHAATPCTEVPAAVECTLEGHPTEGELTAFTHENGTACNYDPQQAKWFTIGKVWSCGKEAHAHGDACYQFLHTVWTLTAVPAQDEPVEEPSERTCEEGCILTSEEEHLENGGECLVWVACTKSEGCEGPEGHDGDCYVSAPMADHTVSFTVKNGYSAVREAEIMIVNAAGETVDYIQTNRYGQAEIDLPDGTYTAIVSYSSGSYDYEGEAKFTVNGDDLTGNDRIEISVERVYSEDYFQGIYDQTSYFNHVDIRVMGTFTTGTTIDLTTYDIKLSNVSVRVDNPSVSNYQDYSFSFTNGNETYEWRKTNIRVHKDAVVSLTCDIVNSRTGEVMKSGFTTSFSGEAAFVQAIKNCDINQGLDFIVNPQEIIEAAFYEVNYQWAVVDANGNVIGSLPAGVATLPGRTTGYKAEDSHTIDNIYREGDYVVVESADGSTATAYQFHGWDWWSHEDDNDLDKNAIGSSQSALSITDDTVIYGVWVAVPLEKATSHLTITKAFVGNGEDLPENYTIVVTGPLGSDYDIPLSMFTESNGVYTYSMPVYTEGTFTIQEMGYTIDGYKEPTAAVTVTDSSDSGHEHLTEVSGSNKGTEVKVQVELHWQEAGSSAAAADSTQHDYLGTVAFTNTYEKELGDPIYNLPNLRINKLDAADRSILPGATFELRDASGAAVFSGTSDESGYIYFFNIPVDTTAENHRTVYTLVETQAPAGYYEGYAKYQVILTLKEGSPTQVLQDGKYHPYYEYDMAVKVNLGDGEWVDSQHFSVGTTGNRFRLAAFNFKIDGQLTITKNITGLVDEDGAANYNRYPYAVIMSVQGKNTGYAQEVTLYWDNVKKEYTPVTLTGLEMDTYYVNETKVIPTAGSGAVDIAGSEYAIPGYFFDGFSYKVTSGHADLTVSRGNAVILSESNAVEQPRVDAGDPYEVISSGAVNVTNTYLRLTDETFVWPVLMIQKERDTNGQPIAGVEFTLYYNNAAIATATTGINGLAIFNFADERAAAKLNEIAETNNGADIRFILKETKAAPGYAENNTQYNVTLHHVSAEETLQNNVHLTTNTYFVNVDTVTGTSATTVFPVKNTVNQGSLTIVKNFGVNNAYVPASVTVAVAGPNNYATTVVLSAANNWTVTLNGLNLGAYTVTETAIKLHNGNTIDLTNVIGNTLKIEDNGHIYYWHIGQFADADIEADNHVVTSATATLNTTTENATATLSNTFSHQAVNPASFQVKKVNGDGQLLPGAEFTLYTDANCRNMVEGTTPITTGTDGIATFTGFTAGGTYYLKETKAPAGYHAIDTVWKVTVALQDGNPVVTVNEKTNVLESIFNWISSLVGQNNGTFANGVLTVTNEELADLTITKSFVDENRIGIIPAEGAVIEVAVFDSNNQLVRQLELSAENNWTAEVNDIPAGVYTIRENSPSLHGYTWNGAEFRVEGADIKNGGTNASVVVEVTAAADVSVTIKNTYTVWESADFYVMKTKLDGKTPLAGAKFNLYADEGCTNDVTNTYLHIDSTIHTNNGNETGSGGILHFHGFEVDEGETATFYLKETDAPYGYTGTDTVYAFTITHDDDRYNITCNSTAFNSGNDVLTVVNEEMFGQLTITKTIGQDSALELKDLESVAFRITGPNGYSENVTLTAADVDADGNWTETLTGLQLGEYTITEQDASVPGYNLAVTYNDQATGIVELTEANVSTAAITVTNTYTVLTGPDVHNPASFTVLKVDKDGKPLAGATFTLKKMNGTEVVETITGTTGTDGVYEFVGLQGSVDANGKPVAGTYILTETTAPAGYLATSASWTVTVDEEDGEVEVKLNTEGNFFQNIYDWIVNIFNPENATWDGTSLTLTVPNEKLVTVSVRKNWDDGDYYARPTEITAQLLCDGDVVDEVVLSAENRWTYNWTSYKEDNNTVYLTDAHTWTVAEKNVPTGYTATITHNGDDWTITNTREANLIDVTVTKEWVLNGKHHEAPESVTVQLLCNGDPVNGEEVILNKDNNWTYTWEDLSDADLWNVTEEAVEGYKLNGITVTENNGDLTFTIENERVINDVTITVNKDWVNGEKNKKVTFPTSVKVALYKDGVKVETITLNKDNDWSYTWDGLTDEYEWKVDEPNVPNGYIKTIKVTVKTNTDGSGDYTYDITNTYNSNPKTGDGMGLWMMGMTAPVLALFVLLIMGGKKKGKYEG